MLFHFDVLDFPPNTYLQNWSFLLTLTSKAGAENREASLAFIYSVLVVPVNLDTVLPVPGCYLLCGCCYTETQLLSPGLQIRDNRLL